VRRALRRAGLLHLSNAEVVVVATLVRALGRVGIRGRVRSSRGVPFFTGHLGGPIATGQHRAGAIAHGLWLRLQTESGAILAAIGGVTIVIGRVDADQAFGTFLAGGAPTGSRLGFVVDTGLHHFGTSLQAGFDAVTSRISRT
jgi:hypothetical protein